MDKFIKEILQVCDKYNMYLSHQDGQGGFLVISNPDERFKSILKEWFSDAELRVETQRGKKCDG